MRGTWWLGAVILSSALVLPALAQQPAGSSQASQFFTGVNPRQINPVKIDPVRAMRRSNMGAALQANATQRTPSVFSMNGIFPKVTLGTWPPKVPVFSSSTAAPKNVSQQFGGNVNLFTNKTSATPIQNIGAQSGGNVNLFNLK